MRTYSIKEISVRLGVNEGSVYRYVRKGKLVAHESKEGVKYVTDDDLQEFLSGRQTSDNHGVTKEPKKESENFSDLHSDNQGVSDLLREQNSKNEDKIKELEAEVKRLNAELISTERQQKDDFKNFTFEYMEHYKQSLIAPQPQTEEQPTQQTEDHIEAEVEEVVTPKSVKELRQELYEEKYKHFRAKGHSKDKAKAKAKDKAFKKYPR